MAIRIEAAHHNVEPAFPHAIDFSCTSTTNATTAIVARSSQAAINGPERRLAAIGADPSSYLEGSSLLTQRAAKYEANSAEPTPIAR